MAYDSKFLSIVKVFEIWHHYLKDCKYEVLILRNYNNLQCIIDPKSLSFK